MIIKLKRLLRASVPENIDNLLSLFQLTREEIPEEQDIWLDTDKIIEIDDVIPGKLSADSFTIYVEGRPDPLYIKKEYFAILMKAWDS